MLAETAIAILAQGQPLAARVAATQPDHHAWLAVYPAPGSRRDGPVILNAAVPADLAVTVRVFEAPTSLLTPERWLAEGDIRRLHDVPVTSAAALADVLARFGLCVEALEQQWRVDFPL